MDTEWDTGSIVDRRDRFFAASQRAFVPYKKPLIFRRGEMQYLWDEHGNKLTDLLAMNVCISVGHAHPAVNKAVKEQIDDLQHATTMFYHPVPAQFAEELVARMPAGHDWVVHFTTSGTEAIDLALVLAQAYTGNIDMLAFRNAYHGATIGAQSLTGISSFRHDIPLLGGIHHIANPDAYRGIFGDDTDAYLAELDRTIQYSTSGKLAGFIFEPIQGYGGITEALPGYLKAAAEKVRERGGVLISDEVQSGFGRTGDHYWAFEAHDIVPEIVVMAKGIGNGFPLAAVVTRREIAESLGSKFLFHTYGANPVACAAGRAVLAVIADEGLQENARVVGAALKRRLVELAERHPVIGDVRGKGLMLAIEFVADRKAKTPAGKTYMGALADAAYEAGALVRVSGNNMIMSPPLVLERKESQQIVDAVTHALDSVRIDPAK